MVSPKAHFCDQQLVHSRWQNYSNNLQIVIVDRGISKGHIIKSQVSMIWSIARTGIDNLDLGTVSVVTNQGTFKDTGISL